MNLVSHQIYKIKLVVSNIDQHDILYQTIHWYRFRYDGLISKVVYSDWTLGAILIYRSCHKSHNKMAAHRSDFLNVSVGDSRKGISCYRTNRSGTVWHLYGGINDYGH